VPLGLFWLGTPLYAVAVGYYTKSDAERGPVGLWMRRERKARGWTVPDVARELAEIGEPVKPATLRQYEAGPREPGTVLLAALVRLYGTEPEELPREPTDIDRLADAINRLAGVLERQEGK
jgi:transcriptional regulator with XRE-family HTH domain